MNRSVIGFDRRIELAWMEIAAELAAQGEKPTVTRAHLLDDLKGLVGAEEDTAARMKTAGVLMRLWIRVPPERRSHHDRGLNLLQSLQGGDRLWIHWGTAIAAYPYFYDIATHLGRLLALQDSVSLASLTQRMAESWGDRSTMRRALQRVVRSMVAWGALKEAGELGLFTGPEAPTQPSVDVAAWLLEAALYSSGSEFILLRKAGSVPCLFPFRIELSPRDIREQPGVELHREGVDREILTLRHASI